MSRKFNIQCLFPLSKILQIVLCLTVAKETTWFVQPVSKMHQIQTSHTKRNHVPQLITDGDILYILT